MQVNGFVKDLFWQNKLPLFYSMIFHDTILGAPFIIVLVTYSANNYYIDPIPMSMPRHNKAVLCPAKNRFIKMTKLH